MLSCGVVEFDGVEEYIFTSSRARMGYRKARQPSHSCTPPTSCIRHFRFRSQCIAFARGWADGETFNHVDINLVPFAVNGIACSVHLPPFLHTDYCHSLWLQTLKFLA